MIHEEPHPRMPIDQISGWYLRDFTTKILLGDEIHKIWLVEACEAYIHDKPMPPPRDAKKE